MQVGMGKTAAVDKLISEQNILLHSVEHRRKQRENYTVVLKAGQAPVSGIGWHCKGHKSRQESGSIQCQFLATPGPTFYP